MKTWSEKCPVSTSQNNSSVEHYILNRQTKFKINQTAFKTLKISDP